MARWSSRRSGRLAGLLAGGDDLPTELRSTLMSKLSGNAEGLDAVVLACTSRGT